MAAERPRLVDQGIADPTALEAELKRRRASIKKSKNAGPASTVGPANGSGLIKLPAPLDAAQMTAAGLAFVSNETSATTGAMLYVYGPAAVAPKV